MTAVEFALAFVFISNALFLVAAAFVLYRILEHTRVGHEALVQAAEETRHAGKQLTHLAHASHDKLGKLGEGGGGGGSGDASALEKLTKLVEELAGRTSGAGAAGRSADGEEGGDERPHRSELDRALAHNHRLRSSLAQVRIQLEEAMKTIADMRRDERIASTEAMENMRQLVTRLNGQLDLARRKSREAEKRAMALENELQQVRSMIETSDSREELTGLQERLDQMQRENSNLTGEVDELKQLIQRTLREKDFIEDRFLKMDSTLDNAPPPPVELMTPEQMRG